MPPRKRARRGAQEDMQTSWQLSVAQGYSLRRAAVSYGFYMLAPNRLQQATTPA